MVSDWPALNALAWLRLPCCDKEHPTRVEGLAGDDIVIGAPSLPHLKPVDPESVREGFFIGWVTDRSAREVPVSLVETADDPVPMWTVRAIGPGEETQRRSYVRLNLNIDIKLYILDGGAPTHAKLLDISEGGLRCQVDKWAIDPGQSLFRSDIEIDGRNYYLRSQIAWWGNADGQGNREVGVRFVDIEPAVADTIRAYIFAAQLAERRRKLE